MALSSYFEASETGITDAQEESVGTASHVSPAQSTSSGPRTLSGASVSDDSPWPSKAPTSARRTQKPRSGGIMTFNDLRSEQKPRDNNNEPVNLFTGGERSGLNVETPEHRLGGTGQNLVDDILSKAASSSHPPVSHDPAAVNLGQGHSDAKRSTAFSGTGYSIGGATVGQGNEKHDHEDGISTHVPDPHMPGSVDLDDPGDEEPAVRHLTFWQDGFSIEDGPLLRYDDPGNQSTLQAINSGRAPLSLLNVRFGQPVELLVARRTHEKYIPPPPPPSKPFMGQGNRLGAPSASGLGDSAHRLTADGIVTKATNKHAAASHAPRESSAKSASSSSTDVDLSKPTVQIQVRLSDGQRLILRLNESHTISDLRREIEV